MSKVIAYLAPEIPALSATFVYQEILALQKQGLTIIPISVFSPLVPAETPEVTLLSKEVYYLYSQSLVTVFQRSFALFRKSPKRYFDTIKLVIQDFLTLGWRKIDSYKLFYHFLQGSQLAFYLQEKSCEHLHIHFAHTPTQIGMYAANLVQIPFSFTAHANDLFERGRLLKEKVARSRFTVTISEYNKKFLAQQKDIPLEKIKIVRCGVETEKYPFLAKSEFKQPLIIGSLGRLVEKKGMDDLILALEILKNQGLNCQLEIAGDGELKETLQELVEDKKLTPQVTFKGKLEHYEVFNWLKNLDLFVLACKPDQNGDQDGIPVVLMEAMMIGIPVISTNISGIPELIQPPIYGELAFPNNRASLAEAITNYLQEDMVLEKTKKARYYIQSEFDQDVNIQRLLKLFQEEL